jgi:hypothetical protein
MAIFTPYGSKLHLTNLDKSIKFCISTTHFEVNTINTMRDIEQKQQNHDTVVIAWLIL